MLNLSGRAWSSLRHDGIQTLGDLTRRTEQQLRAIENIGPASLADIKSKLADRGLALADSADKASAAPAASAVSNVAADGNGTRQAAGRARRRGGPRRGHPAAPGPARVVGRRGRARAAGLAATGQRGHRPARRGRPAGTQARRPSRRRPARPTPRGARHQAPPPRPPQQISAHAPTTEFQTRVREVRIFRASRTRVHEAAGERPRQAATRAGAR